MSAKERRMCFFGVLLLGFVFFVMVFEVGSVAGPLLGGKVMDIQGPSGFILTISVLTFLFLMVSLYRTIRR